MARTKSKRIYIELKKRIETGIYPVGENFPSNFELMVEFDVHSATIQSAVNLLIKEGMVISFGSKNIRRKVLPFSAKLIT